LRTEHVARQYRRPVIGRAPGFLFQHFDGVNVQFPLAATPDCVGINQVNPNNAYGLDVGGSCNVTGHCYANGSLVAMADEVNALTERIANLEALTPSFHINSSRL
jgi:hypothetical protein